MTNCLLLDEELLELTGQRAADFSGRYATFIGREKILPQFHLRQPNLASERGLGYVRYIGRTGQTAQFGHVNKIFQLLEMHRLIVKWCGTNYAILL